MPKSKKALNAVVSLKMLRFAGLKLFLFLIIATSIAGLWCEDTVTGAGDNPAGIRFEYDCEACQGSFLTGYQLGYIYNNAEVGIPVWKLELELGLFHYAYDYVVTDVYNETYPHSYQFQSADAFLMFPSWQGWKVGLGTRFRGPRENFINETKFVGVVLTKTASIGPGSLHGRLSYEENLQKDSSIHSLLGFPVAVRTHYFTNKFDMGQFMHLYCLSLGYQNKGNPEDKSVPENMPLLYAEPGTLNLQADGFYDHMKQDYEDDYLKVTRLEGQGSANYLPADWLELHTNATSTDWCGTQTDAEFSTSTFTSETGATFRLNAFPAGKAFFRCTYLYDEVRNKSQDNTESDIYPYNICEVNRFVIPSFGLAYRLTDHVLVNAMLSRKYYVNKDNEYTAEFNKTRWDGALAVSVGY